jgi:hypothetical protein
LFWSTCMLLPSLRFSIHDIVVTIVTKLQHCNSFVEINWFMLYKLKKYHPSFLFLSLVWNGVSLFSPYSCQFLVYIIYICHTTFVETWHTPFFTTFCYLWNWRFISSGTWQTCIWERL